MSISQFASRVMEAMDKSISKMTVYLSDRFITGTYGSSVLPMRVICQVNKTERIDVGFNQLLDIFGYIPYISTNKPLQKEFMCIEINTSKKKQFNEHVCYDSYLHVLELNEKQREVFIQLRDKVHERIHQFKSVDSLDLSEFATL